MKYRLTKKLSGGEHSSLFVLAIGDGERKWKKKKLQARPELQPVVEETVTDAPALPVTEAATEVPVPADYAIEIRSGVNLIKLFPRKVRIFVIS